MKTAKIFYLLLFILVLCTSCQKEDPADAYIGVWTLVNLTGAGTTNFIDLGTSNTSKIVFDSGNASIDIRENGSMFTEMEINAIIEIYEEDVLISSSPFPSIEPPSEGTWSLDDNDQFVSTEFGDQEEVRFEDDQLIITIETAVVTSSLEIFQTTEFVYERN